VKKIGFQEQYYTLWEVSEVYIVKTGAYSYYEKQDITYIKNLSKDKDEAIKKVFDEFGVYVSIDFSLKGINNTSKIKEFFTFNDNQFTFGKLKGEEINKCNDIYQINRAWQSEKNENTKIIAFNRLIELGYLIEFRGEYKTQGEIDSILEYEAKPITDFFFSDKEKVKIELELFNQFNFQTQFGTSYIQEFKDTENRLFKYIGRNPIDTKLNKKELISFTVKHNEYNNKKETHIIRAKIV
jgi:hypothetical protein